MPAALALAAGGLFTAFFFGVFRRIGLPPDEVFADLVCRRLGGQLAALLARPSAAAWSALRLPLLVYDKHGAGDFYLTLPFLWLLGHGPAAFQWRNLALGWLVLWLTWRLAVLLYDDAWAAAAACVLLAASPTFVLFSIMGLETSTAAAALGLASLCLAVRFARTRRPRDAWLACGALGLSLFFRSTMAAFALGAAACALVWRKRLAGLFPEAPGRRRRLLGACAAAGLAGPAALAAGAWRDRASAGPYWVNHLLRPGGGGSNLAFLQNLLVRLAQCAALFGGSPYLDHFALEPGRYAAHGGALALAAAAASLALLLGKRGPPARGAALWVLSAVFLAASAFTPSVLDPYHLLPLMPVLCLLPGPAVAALARRRPSWAWAALAVLLALKLGDAARFGVRLCAELDRTGAVGPSLTPMALSLGEDFARRPELTAVTFSDSLASVIEYSGGRARSLPDGLGRGVTTDAEWDGLLSRAGSRFVVSMTSPDAPFQRVLLERQAARRGLQLASEESIARPDGEEFFRVYGARPGPSGAVARSPEIRDN